MTRRSSASVAAIVGGSWRQRQPPALMCKGHTGDAPPTSSTGAAAPMVWWMLGCDSHRCVVAAARSAPRLERSLDGCDICLKCETSHQSASIVLTWRGVLANATTDRSVIKMLMKHLFMLGMKTLDLTFICWAQERQTYVATLSKALSTYYCDGFNYLLVSTTRMRNRCPGHL